MNDDRSQFLLVLQYWEGDRAQMRALIKLLSDLDPGLPVDVLLVCRFDSEIDRGMLADLKRRFKVVRTLKCRRTETGWPMGPNAMWFEAVMHIYEAGKAGVYPWYQVIFTTEADAAPLARGWAEKLMDCWNRAKQSAVGCVLSAPVQHMNGNMLLSGAEDYLRWIYKLGGCHASSGWDAVLAPKFRKLGWKHVGEIRSWWRHAGPFDRKFIERQLAEGVVWFHGCKSTALVEAVRSYLFPVKVEKL